VAKELSKDVLTKLARRGAEARLEELEKERREILRAFPGLSTRGKRGDETESREEVPAKGPSRRRRKMTPAARKAASERMKRYWENKRQSESS
jgi:hypothetical protein